VRYRPGWFRTDRASKDRAMRLRSPLLTDLRGPRRRGALDVHAPRWLLTVASVVSGRGEWKFCGGTWEGRDDIIICPPPVELRLKRGGYWAVSQMEERMSQMARIQRYKDTRVGQKPGQDKEEPRWKRTKSIVLWQLAHQGLKHKTQA